MGRGGGLPTGEACLAFLVFGQVDLAGASGVCWVALWGSGCCEHSSPPAAQASGTDDPPPPTASPAVLCLGWWAWSQALGRVWLVRAALLAGSALLVALLELNHRRRGGQ